MSNLLTYKRCGSITYVRSDRETSIAWTRVHAIPITSTCLIWSLSNRDRRPTWWHVEALESDRLPSLIEPWIVIFVDRDHDLHRTDGIAICRNDRDLHRTDGIAIRRDGRISIRQTTKGHQNAASSCDRDSPTYLIKSDGRRNIIKNHDRGAIVALLRPNQGQKHHQVMGHDRHAIVAIKPLPRPDQMALKIGPKFPLKGQCIPPYFLNFWSIREAIKQIWSKVLSSLWSPRV